MFKSSSDLLMRWQQISRGSDGNKSLEEALESCDEFASQLSNAWEQTRCVAKGTKAAVGINTLRSEQRQLKWWESRTVSNNKI